MIFHHPEPLKKDPKSGSQVRPCRMIEAFKELGYEVEAVVGYGNERKQAAERIYCNLAKGIRYDFLYAESSTTPTLLTESHHFPTYPFLDFGLFRRLKKINIPIGLYYRDVHWRFPFYRQAVQRYKRAVSTPFYWYDWLSYKQLVDILFLPSKGMKYSLPGNWPEEKLYALPPGSVIRSLDSKEPKSRDHLKIFYVGGITPPLYDIKPMTETVKSFENIELTICCHSQEWENYQSYYSINGSKNIKIVHTSGDDLKNYYQEADIFGFLSQNHPYLNFAMPVKVFEAIGHGLPLILSDGTETAKLVTQEDIGWAVSSAVEFKTLLAYLLDHHESIMEKRARVIAARERHTWFNRAKMAAELLTTLVH